MARKKNIQMKKSSIALTLLQLMFFTSLAAQTGGGGDFLRSAGKIYVVVAVIATIFLGLVLFLIYLDRRLTKLENQIKEHEH